MKDKNFAYVAGYCLGCVALGCIVACLSAAAIALTIKFISFMF